MDMVKTAMHGMQQFSQSSQIDGEYHSHTSQPSPHTIPGTEGGDDLSRMQSLITWLTFRQSDAMRIWLATHSKELCCPYNITLLTVMMDETPCAAFADELRWRRDLLLRTKYGSIDTAIRFLAILETASQ